MRVQLADSDRTRIGSPGTKFHWDSAAEEEPYSMTLIVSY